jgi:hypothetical protein
MARTIVMVRPLCFAKWDKKFYFSGHQRPAALGARKGGWPCKPSVFPTPQGVTCIQPNPHPKVSVAHQRLEKFYHFLDCGFRVFWVGPVYAVDGDRNQFKVIFLTSAFVIRWPIWPSGPSRE